MSNQPDVHEEVQQSQGKSAFEITHRKIRNPHHLQLYIDTGHSTAGPWLIIGLNSTEYGIGYKPGHVTAAPLRAVAPEGT